MRDFAKGRKQFVMEKRFNKKWDSKSKVRKFHEASMKQRKRNPAAYNAYRTACEELWFEDRKADGTYKEDRKWDVGVHYDYREYRPKHGGEKISKEAMEKRREIHTARMNKKIAEIKERESNFNQYYH